MRLAKQILNEMNTLGMDAIIAGGYPRDIAHNQKPKDIDIITLGNDKQMYDLYKYLSNNNLLLQLPTISLVTENSSEDYQDEDIWCVMKIKTDGIPIDIIFWDNHKYSDLEHVITSGFDYNINQYIMKGDAPEFIGVDEGWLTQIKDDIQPKRAYKMKTIAYRLGYATTTPPSENPF